MFLTGGTGFLGRYVLRALLQAGHEVRCLVRRGGAPEGFGSRKVEVVRGDINEPLQGLLRDCSAVVHLVGIIREIPQRRITFDALHTAATRNLVRAASKSGATRFVYVSANGASKDGISRYQTSKWEAEEAVRNSGLAHWCILRPGLIFGDPGLEREEFCTRLAADLIRPFKLIPVFGAGDYQLQPVNVEEVAQAVVQALELEEVNGRTICAVGRTAYTYLALIDEITRALGLKIRVKVHVPLPIVRFAMRVAGGLLPLTTDQLNMLVAGNTGDANEFYDSFNLAEHPFSPEALAYVRERS